MLLVTSLLGVLQGAVPLQPGDIVAANLRNSTVSVHAADGTFRGTLADSSVGGLQGPTGVAFDRLGRLYVASSRTSAILRFSAEGRFDRIFVRDPAMGAPFSIAFGPDGHLYVSSGSFHRVLRFDGQSGTPLGVAADGNGLRVPIGLAFGADGTLYVASGGSNTVLAFDGRTGMFLRVVAAEGLKLPSDLLVEADGSLLVSSAGTGEVVRFDPRTARRMEVVATLPQGAVPMGLVRSCGGELLIGDFSQSRLFTLANGAVVLRSSTGLTGPENLAIVPGCVGKRR